MPSTSMRARTAAAARCCAGSRIASIAYRGTPLPLPADRAFAETVARFDIPRAIPAALLEGLAWDAESRRYATLADLHAYAARVAGTVGVMMALVMGVREPAALARACDLGAAMQLTNIARDIGEDARAGRLYLPLEWLAEAGIDADAFLADPRFTPALGGVKRRGFSPRPRGSIARARRASPRCRSPAAQASVPPVCSTPRSGARWREATATR
jgi:15-cis-phytoene synthase